MNDAYIINSKKKNSLDESVICGWDSLSFLWSWQWQRQNSTAKTKRKNKNSDRKREETNIH